MTNAIDQSAKNSYILVEFRYGDPAAPSTKRYTDWLSPADNTYQPFGALEVKCGSNNGVFDEQLTTIALPSVNDGFVEEASNGEPFSPIYVTIDELTVAALGGAPQTIRLFSGQVAKVSRNFQGKDAIVFSCVTVKARLAVPLGLQANPQCVWTLGGRGCGVAVPTDSGVLTANDNNKIVTITGLAGAPDSRYWTRGFVTFEGLRIVIRDWDSSDATTFALAQRPPASWYGATVLMTPGCDKTIEVCRARWANEQHFGGFGYAIPAYMPLLESP